MTQHAPQMLSHLRARRLVRLPSFAACATLPRRVFSASPASPPHAAAAAAPPLSAELPPAGAPADPADAVRAALLDAALRHVPQHGWSWEALSAGAAELG